MEQQPNQPLNIEISEEIAEGTYANLAIITHSNAEFVVDFVQILPGLPQAKVRSRVILTPQHAKRMLSALADNIDRYEKSFGTVAVQDGPGNNFPPGFTGPTGIA